MSTRLYVGNLSYSTQDDSLRAAFAAHGNVIAANVVTDRESGRSRGFGFVEYESATDAEKAIQSLNGIPLDGRPISVSVARERPKSGPPNAGPRGRDSAAAAGDGSTGPSDGNAAARGTRSVSGRPGASEEGRGGARGGGRRSNGGRSREREGARRERW